MEPVLKRQPSPRLAELRQSMLRYQQRYGSLSGIADVTKAVDVMTTKQRKLDTLEREMARLRSQAMTLESEVGRLERWVEFCIEDVIDKARHEHGEGWSPMSVLGYRLWWINDEALHGVKMPWLGRTLRAKCLSRGGDEEIPHSDGRCGRLGCGVYVTKTVGPLYTEFDVSAIGNLALGLVALTGKVVEHEDGYRGAFATVVALAASFDSTVLLSSDPDEIDRVFADPTVIRNHRMVEDERQRLQELEAFVISEERRAESWILGSNKE